MKFLDQVKISIKAGDGGTGSPSFRREKFIEFGGPDGGNGGDGGSIILVSERNLNTLIDYRYQQHFKAKRGGDGKGKNQTGKKGEDLYLKVPVGTQVFEEDKKTMIFDFKKKMKNTLLLLVEKVALETLNLNHLQTGLQENLQKELLVKIFGFGFNLKLLLMWELLVCLMQENRAYCHLLQVQNPK